MGKGYIHIALSSEALNKVFAAHYAHTHTQMAASYHAGCWSDHRERFGVQCLNYDCIALTKVCMHLTHQT